MSPLLPDINSTLNNAVLGVLQYYSLFHYPLTISEIHGNASCKCSLLALQSELNELVISQQIYEHEGFYFLDKDIATYVDRRKEGNRNASRKINRAIRTGRFIYHFPFVRFVGISGSLSKGYSDKQSDFDFFIVTELDRLWICRTALHLFKKTTFLLGQQHKFCMNYFIDLSNLEIEEKNRFTAIELLSLIPVAGKEVYEALMADNEWKDSHFPNGFKKFHIIKECRDKKGIIKTFAESVLNKVKPAAVNKMLMNITDAKWRKKWAKRNFPMQYYDIAFKTTLHVSKNHPANHQERVIKAMAKFNVGQSA